LPIEKHLKCPKRLKSKNTRLRLRLGIRLNPISGARRKFSDLNGAEFKKNVWGHLPLAANHSLLTVSLSLKERRASWEKEEGDYLSACWRWDFS
jgi:hypothetical protein